MLGNTPPTKPPANPPVNEDGSSWDSGYFAADGRPRSVVALDDCSCTCGRHHPPV